MSDTPLTPRVLPSDEQLDALVVAIGEAERMIMEAGRTLRERCVLRLLIASAEREQKALLLSLARGVG